MYLKAGTLDDLLRRVLERLLKEKARGRNRVVATRGGTTELRGVLLHLTNARARLSYTERKGTVFSSLGELLWYLAGSDALEFIGYYLPDYAYDSDDGKTLYGAYGPRIWAMRGNCNQVENLITLLKKKPSSRRAVLQLFNAEDTIGHPGEVPCTCSFQFLLRDGRLDMVTCMRSNDAFKGLPHDVFAFTMIQEIMARTLAVEVGPYRHFIASLHLYDDAVQDAQKYLAEGWQPTTFAMQPMPLGDPWPAIKDVLNAEADLRSGSDVDIAGLEVPGYWADLVRLLQIYRMSKKGNGHQIAQVRKEMTSDTYDPYIARRQRRSRPTSAKKGGDK